MKVIDANILIYAVNTNSPNHSRVISWWRTQLDSLESIGLSWIAISGFVRVMTNRRAVVAPLLPSEAIATIDRWLDLPQVQIVRESPHHWKLMRDLLREAGTAGNLTTDAHLAAIAISTGSTVASCDFDFDRFKNLKVINPLRD